jgi:hypothetical protein
MTCVVSVAISSSDLADDVSQSLCCYCETPANPVSDCWISHGAMAHYGCAWTVEESWVPRSQIVKGSTVVGKDDGGALVVTRWCAE